MCFSAMVDQDQKRLEKRFGADFPTQAKMEFNSLQALEKQHGPDYIKQALGLARKPTAGKSKFPVPGSDGRIYPGYFTHVMILNEGQRQFVPMRFRVRPAGYPKELPTKYNVHNARRDKLLERPTWEKIFGKRHALLPFFKFYEWVERGPDNKKTLINFTPDHYEIMWSACIYDEWQSYDGLIRFRSFAMVTDDPPPEVAAAGHDRCPIFLKEELINDWLSPEQFSQADLLAMLEHKEQVHYSHAVAA